MIEAADTLALSDAVILARDLVRLDTVNPPGNEAIAARLLADRLAATGAAIEVHELEPGRESVIARFPPVSSGEPALCLCGHIDVVPLGRVPWTHPPLEGRIEEDRLWGRGSSDMKGGVAAMVVAFERMCALGVETPLMMVLTASEETGCQGASAIAGQIGPVGAMIIGEPTSEKVVVAHKGVLWLRLTANGIAAHGSRPELGDNAIDRMQKALALLGSTDFPVARHNILGDPTLNIGTIAGGSATNIVPDRCQATVDIRLVPGLDATTVLEGIRLRLGDDIEVEPLLALDAVQTAPDDPWVSGICTHALHHCGVSEAPSGATFFTDASVLAPALGHPPIVLIGPGDPALAHQVDEWCSIAAIDRMTAVYEDICRTWCGLKTARDTVEEKVS